MAAQRPRRGYDPTLGRFAQADTIIPPGLQGLDRFAYVSNNPVRFTDPTGHAQATDDGGGLGCGATNTCPPANPSGGGVEEEENKPQDDDATLSDVAEDFFSNVAYTLDVIGVIAADMEFIVVDTLAAIVIAEGCLIGVACIPALIFALAIDYGVSTFSPFGIVENSAGGVALLATAIADGINGTTYIHSNGNGGYDVGVGRDTVVSAVNAVSGLVPEANYDAWISNKQLEYDNKRRSGEFGAITLLSYSISELWGNGNGWPNTTP